MAASLYVAHDDELAIVSRLPLTVVGGRGNTFTWGSVVEITPGEQSPDDGAVPAVLYVLAAVCVLLGGAFLLAGALGGGLIVLLGLVAGAGGAWQSWRQRPGVIAAPRLESDREQHHILVDAQDRKLFSDAIDLCQRTTETWPALGALVDVPVAEHQLAQALFDLAGTLEKRQELRELHGELAEHDGAFELAPRLARTTEALAELDDEVTRRRATLTTVAVAGEELIRDQEIDALAREADETIARLTSAHPSTTPDAGTELAERTEAVLRAYRELS